MIRDNVILEIEDKDMPQLNELLNTTFNDMIDIDKMKESYALSKENKNTHILGYYKKDMLIGSLALNVLVLPNMKCGLIWNVAVKEEFKRQKIATKLMIEAEKIAEKDKDISRLWLFSGYQRTGAHKLYQNLGYDGNRTKGFVKFINGS